MKLIVKYLLNFQILNNNRPPKSAVYYYLEYKLFFDGVEIGGVELYLGATEDSGLNLFI